MTNKAILMILDGWGLGDGSPADVIANTPTPNIDALTRQYPHARLLACGENVGLPDGQMGNSEVGHLNIGAGRVVYQDLVRINKAIADGSIGGNPALNAALDHAKASGKALHLLGLVSDGGVHSLDTHLHKLCDLALERGLDKIYIHALTDGRDCDPKSGLGFISELQKHIDGTAAKIATITGRYYTMDRDKRWERVKQGYDALVNGAGQTATCPVEAMRRSYEQGVTDEFVKPTVITGPDGKPLATIADGDTVICFNFRTDRLREITTALTQTDMPQHGMRTLQLHYATMTRYDDTFQGVDVLFDKDNLDGTLGEVVSQAGLRQLRIAETEKYAHVTFFFSGGREEPFEGERRRLVASPKVATYDLQPQMSAPEVKEAVLEEIARGDLGFICLNFANGDMVGHTGVYPAIQTAVATVDACVGEIAAAARQAGYDLMIIADHGNADHAVNADSTPNTAHSLNPVPCIVVSDRFASVADGVLADVAPTLCKMMGIAPSAQMTGRCLV